MMSNHGQTRTGFGNVCQVRLAMCVVLTLSTIIARAKNLYNDWAQENAVNLNKSSLLNKEGTGKLSGDSPNEYTASFQQDVANPNSRAEYRLLNSINSTDCDTAHVIDSIIGADVPKTLVDMREYHMGQYGEVSPVKSLYHNLKENTVGKPSMFELIIEYKTINMMKTAGLPTRVINLFTKYLDPEMPNIKFVSKDGHKEVVYNRFTGDIVRGINAGTSNKATNDLSPDHWWEGDIQRFDRCRTPEEKHRMIGEKIASNPRLVEWLAEDPSRMDGIVEAIKLASSEYRQKAKKTLLNEGGIETPPNEAKCIDTSRLESLLKEGIVFLKNLIAKGERATNSQINEHNQRIKEIVEEFVKIAKQIESMNVSAEEKKRIGEELLAKIEKLQSQFGNLCERAKSMGLVHEATTEQKRDVFKDMQGKQTEASRDTEKAKESSAKASASSQGRTMTEEDVFRMLREDGSGIKVGSDALKN